MRYLFLLPLLTLLGGPAMAANPTTKTAIFAGGCFWCMQPGFDSTPGVVKTEVGYTGGTNADPTYEQVSSGATGHIEAIKVTYDPAKVSYETLLSHYWQNIDPTDPDGQFADKGSQYHTVIFVDGDEQRKAAEKSKEAVAAKLAPAKIATIIVPAQPFYDAEDYHQKYYEKNKAHYTMYKYGSGRVGRLKELWGAHE